MSGVMDNGDMWLLGLMLALAGGALLIWLRERRAEREERRAEREERRAEMRELHAKLDAMNARLENLGAKVGAVEVKVEAVEAKVEANAEQLRGINERVGELSERMASTEGLVEGLKMMLSYLGLVRERASPSPFEPSDGGRRSGREAAQESQL